MRYHFRDLCRRAPIAIATPASNVRRKSFKTTLIFAAMVFLVCQPFWYAGMYAGDAEIHLVYAEHASHGHYFEYNLGEKSSGITSPGYMLSLSLLFNIFPPHLVPLVTKILNIILWYMMLTLVYALSMFLLNNATWTWIVVVVAGALPGSVYNATIGMENGIFAFLVLLATFVLIKSDFFDERPSEIPAHKWLTLATLLGLLCWTRPEGFVVSALMMAGIGYFRYVKSRSWDLFGKELPDLMSSTGLFVAIAGGVAAFHYVHTGEWLPTSTILGACSPNLAG